MWGGGEGGLPYARLQVFVTNRIAQKHCNSFMCTSSALKLLLPHRSIHFGASSA